MTQNRLSDRTTRLIVAAGILAMIFGLLLILAPGIFAGVGTPLGLMLTAFLTSVAVAGVVRRARVDTDTAMPKRKRGVEEIDLYSLIDRLVDELNSDELDYLHQRLSDRDRGTDQAVAESVADLLDQRAEAKHARL